MAPYAIERLKLFPYPITQAFPDATREICSLSARWKAAEGKKGTYAFKGSGAFYSFAKSWDN